MDRIASDPILTPRQRVMRRVGPNLAVMWTATDVFPAAMSWEEAKAALSGINRETALLCMAMLNAVAADFSVNRSVPRGLAGHAAIGHLADYLFAPEYRQRAMEVWRGSCQDAFVAIAPQACAAMTEACLRYCPVQDGARFEQPSRHPELARILLSFQSALVGEEVRSQARSLNVEELTAAQFADFTRNYLSANFETDLYGLLRRFYLMFVRPITEGSTLEKCGRSPSQWFREVAGLDPQVYAVMQVMAFFHGRQFTIVAPNLTHLVYDLDQTTGNLTAEATEAVKRIHALTVVDTTLSEVSVQDWGTAVFGLNYLRLRPALGLLGTRYLCLNKQMMVEKYLAGTVHLLTEVVERHPPPGWDASPRLRRLRVRRELGPILEDYVRLIVGILFGGLDVVIRSGVRRGADGECDILVVAGGTAIVFELVNHPWSLMERARGAAEDFVKHLSDNVTKAGQMCRELLASGLVDGDRSIVVTRAIPIVVMSEMMPVNELTSHSLRKKLETEVGTDFVAGTGTILPIQTLSLTQLEHLDRVPGAVGAGSLIELLVQRAQQPLDRFNGDPRMSREFGPTRGLDRFEQEMMRSFEENGHAMFRPETWGR